jgi:hypothetical protein
MENLRDGSANGIDNGGRPNAGEEDDDDDEDGGFDLARCVYYL